MYYFHCAGGETSLDDCDIRHLVTAFDTCMGPMAVTCYVKTGEWELTNNELSAITNCSLLCSP